MGYFRSHGHYRHQLESLALRVMCQLTSGSPKQGVGIGEKLYRTKILTGFVRGMYFSMPKLEKVSFGIGTFEPHVVECMRRYIKPNGVVYDVGANAGYHTLVMSKIVHESGQVFAFEPDPKNVAALNKNIQDNQLKNVTAIPKAVSNETGEVSFATFNYSLVGHIATENTPKDAKFFRVPAITLDDLVYNEGFPPPNFMKIDVEGAEAQVILGAKRAIQEFKPIILMEVRKGEVYQKITSVLTDQLYDIIFLSDDWQDENNLLADLLFVPKA